VRVRLQELITLHNDTKTRLTKKSI